jgi:hypothetical protein
MFCPQCGQQQVSGETRFCSRCGFPLGGVLSLLNSGGIPIVSAASTSPKMLSPRRKGYRQGAMLMIICLIITPLMAVLTEAGLPELLVPLSAIIFFWGGIIRMIYARIFQDATPQAAPDTLPPYIPPVGQPQFGAGARQDALPPQRNVPVTGWRQTDTAEIVPPPSVTENTTRLLDDKAEPPVR